MLNLSLRIGPPQLVETPHALELENADSPEGREVLAKYMPGMLGNASANGREGFSFQINGVQFLVRVMPDDDYGHGTQATSNTEICVGNRIMPVSQLKESGFASFDEYIIAILSGMGSLKSSFHNCADVVPGKTRKRVPLIRAHVNETSWQMLGSMDEYTVFRGERDGFAVFKLVDANKPAIEVTLRKVSPDATIEEVRAALQLILNNV